MTKPKPILEALNPGDLQQIITFGYEAVESIRLARVAVLKAGNREDGPMTRAEMEADLGSLIAVAKGVQQAIEMWLGDRDIPTDADVARMRAEQASH